MRRQLFLLHRLALKVTLRTAKAILDRIEAMQTRERER